MWTSNLWGVLQPGTWWLRCQPEAMELCVTAQWQNKKRSQENGTCWQKGKTINLIQKFMMEVALSSIALICCQMADPEFKLLSRNVPEKSLVMAIDFAENFTCFSQHEFQGANWAHDAVTIHPAISYYNCTKRDDHAVIEECVHVISDDWKHDADAVYCFVGHIIQHLRQQISLSSEKIYNMSDGAPSHYTSWNAFLDVSLAENDYGPNPLLDNTLPYSSQQFVDASEPLVSTSPIPLTGMMIGTADSNKTYTVTTENKGHSGSLTLELTIDKSTGRGQWSNRLPSSHSETEDILDQHQEDLDY